jgi:pSer/pThr/pTyr-binding forkhead associated (FHA) protein
LALDWSGAQSELLIGRHHGCDVIVDEPTVSRRHARLVFRDHKWIVQDLTSTNGTIVNGTRVGRCELRPGDSVVLGRARLKVD